MPKTDIEKIIAGCKRGSAESFSMLIDIYATRCYGYFYRLTGNRTISDDLLSELFVKLVEKIATYRGGSFESWLFRIAANIFHDHLRSLQQERKILAAKKEQLDLQVTGAGEYRDDEKIDRLQQKLAKLDNETRELIMLRFYSQVSFKEIAKMRSEPIGTTISKLHRGLKKLRELME